MATPLDVRENDIVIHMGYRCRATNVRHIPEEQFTSTPAGSGPVARYTLTSEPNADYPKPLPVGYEGMTSGGNRLARGPVIEQH